MAGEREMSTSDKELLLMLGDAHEQAKERARLRRGAPAPTDFTAEFTPTELEQGARDVRVAWIEWARTQPDPKPSWLVPYDELAEPDKEADRQIWAYVAGKERIIAAHRYQELADLVTYAELHFGRFVWTQLTTDQKELLADLIDAKYDRQDAEENTPADRRYTPTERWWR
jgi:hypothetical protein